VTRAEAIRRFDEARPGLGVEAEAPVLEAERRYVRLPLSGDRATPGPSREALVWSVACGGACGMVWAAFEDGTGALVRVLRGLGRGGRP